MGKRKVSLSSLGKTRCPVKNVCCVRINKLTRPWYLLTIFLSKVYNYHNKNKKFTKKIILFLTSNFPI